MSDFRNDTDHSRYERDEQGLTSWADYRLADDRIYIMHVESPPPLRGTGAAGRLMADLVEDRSERSGSFQQGFADLDRQRQVLEHIGHGHVHERVQQ